MMQILVFLTQEFVNEPSCIVVQKMEHDRNLIRLLNFLFLSRLLPIVYAFLPVGSLCHTLGVVRRTLCVICVHHNYRNTKDIKSILLAPATLAIKLWFINQIFTLSTSSVKPPADGTSYYARRFPKPNA